MTDLCTVIINSDMSYLNTLIESLLWYRSAINKIIIADLYVREAYEKKYSIKNIDVLKFGYNPPYNYNRSLGWNDYGHALGLHACLDRSDSEYVIFSDPDVYFKMDVVDLYIKYLNQGFDLVGVELLPELIKDYSAFKKFPTVINMMFKRSWLPTADFLKGKLYIRNNLSLTGVDFKINRKDIRVDGKYLIQGFIMDIAKEFPNPGGIFDVGSNLWLWCKEKNSKWLCFADNTYYTNNSELIINTLKPLMVHKTHSFTANKDLATQFHQEYLSSIKGKIKLY